MAIILDKINKFNTQIFNCDCNYKLTWVIRLSQPLSGALPMTFPKISIWDGYCRER